MFCLFASTEDIDFVIKIYQNVIKKFLKKYGQFTVINFVKNKRNIQIVNILVLKIQVLRFMK